MIEGAIPDWLEELINKEYTEEKAKMLRDQIEEERTIILRARPVLEEIEVQEWTTYKIQA